MGILAACPLGVAEATAKTVRNVNVDVEDVFDPTNPAEDAWPYRAVNALHIRTRDHVIRDQLLLKPGQPISRALIAESERNLRALTFLRAAAITPVSVNKSTVDLHVRVQDSWTTQPQINFGSEGGQNKYSAGIVEENVFGLGKSFSYFYRHNPENNEQEYSYTDPLLFGSRYQLQTNWKNTSEGNERSLRIERPFYSIATRWSYGGTFDTYRRLTRSYAAAEEISRYDTDHTDYHAFVGRRLNNDEWLAYRLSLRWNAVQDTYTTDSRTLAGSLPANSKVAGPELRWTREPARFFKDEFVDKAGRVEDINLGHQAVASLGFSGRGLGSTDDSVPVTLQHSFGVGGNERPWFILATYGLAGRYQTDGQEPSRQHPANTLYFAAANYYHHSPTDWPVTHIVHAESAYMQNPDSLNPIQLGGDTGLRGYKVNSFTGNKSILLNWESRFFYPQEVLRIVYLGAAVFADAGQVQPLGDPFRTKDFHADVGFGFRFGLSRSSGGNIYRVDVAYALGPVTEGKRVIVSLSTNPGFARSANTYSNSGAMTAL